MKFRTFVAIGSIIAVSSLAFQINHMTSLSAIVARNSQNAAAFVGKRAVVVGGTSGIGQGIALRLAKANMKVTIVGRDAARGAQIVQQMNDAGGSDHDFIPCDCFSIANVRKCSRDILSKSDILHMLVLTQGMATIQGFTPTQEGLDQKLTLHYFSRVAFIESLLPALRKSDDARVLSVLSAGVHSAYEGYNSDFTLERTYSIKNAADSAGFYNDLALDSLSRENPSMSFQHAAPGFV
jgi:NAD(P)-dependent dehydrogenase (short-subunit alcohol dehydrogenase family)